MRFSPLLFTSLAAWWCLIPAPVRADSWRPYPKETFHYSANGRFHLRIDTVKRFEEYRLTLKERSANGWRLRWRASSPWKHHPPAYVYVANDGRHVVLRDQYIRRGRDKVLVFLDHRGRVINSLELNEFLTKREILDSLHTISSTHWDSTGIVYLRPNNRHFVVVTDAPRVVVMNLLTGKPVTVGDRLRRAVLKEAQARERELIRDEKQSVRQGAAVRLSYLGGRDGIPTLKKMLNSDSYCRITIAGRKPQRLYSLRLRSGSALVRLLGREAVPLLQARSKGANSYMRGEWKELIEQAQAAGVSGDR